MIFLKFLTKTVFLVAIAVLAVTGNIIAQDKNANQTQTTGKKKVVFKIPDGFMPAEIPPDKKGLMMLNPKKPSGIFIAYTPDNKKSEDFIAELRNTLASFFVSDKDVKFEWTESALPVHENATHETGKLLTTTAKDKEVQIVAYTRTISEGQDVVYGYFAMKDTKSKKNSAALADASGKGVKEFESFVKTIGIGK